MSAIFRVVPGTNPLDITGGVPISRLDQVTWIERYRDWGEFTITAPLFSGVLDALPLDSIIGHEGRLELMVVETHEVVESGTNDPKVTIKGRSLDSVTESRIAGTWSAQSNLLADYTVNNSGTNYGSVLVKTLLDDALVSSPEVTDDMDLVVRNDYQAGTTYSAPKVINKGPVSVPVKELLAQDDLGLKIVRPHSFTSRWGTPTVVVPTLIIHNGTDVSDDVSFSYFQGDIEQADYFWSNKYVATSVLVNSSFCSVVVDDGVSSGYDRRYQLLDASYLDERESVAPSGAALTDLLAQMTNLGNEYLASSKPVTLVEVDISRSTDYQYEKDYSIGDIVNVHANYGVSQKMRVVEHATIFDEQGTTGFPTLSAI